MVIKKSHWSTEEKSILKNKFSEMLLDEICLLLPNRTAHSIQNQAGRLGLKKSEITHKRIMSNLHEGARKPRTWSLGEKQKLIERYPDSTKKELELLFPNHSYEAICANAHLLGRHKTEGVISKQKSSAISG